MSCLHFKYKKHLSGCLKKGQDLAKKIWFQTPLLWVWIKRNYSGWGLWLTHPQKNCLAVKQGGKLAIQPTWRAHRDRGVGQLPGQAKWRGRYNSRKRQKCAKKITKLSDEKSAGTVPQEIFKTGYEFSSEKKNHKRNPPPPLRSRSP